MNKTDSCHFRSWRFVDAESGTLLGVERVKGSESIDWGLYRSLALGDGVVPL